MGGLIEGDYGVVCSTIASADTHPRQCDADYFAPLPTIPDPMADFGGMNSNIAYIRMLRLNEKTQRSIVE
jgi:hypothetical protein